MVSDELKVKLGGVWVEEVGPVEGVHGAKGGGQEDEGEPVDGGDHPRLLDVVSQEEDGAELNLGIMDSSLNIKVGDHQLYEDKEYAGDHPNVQAGDVGYPRDRSDDQILNKRNAITKENTYFQNLRKGEWYQVFHH